MSTRMVIGVVGLAMVLAIGGIIALAFTGHPIPDVLQNIAIGSLTLLGGILVPNRQTAPDALSG